MKRNLYAEVSERICAELERGAAPGVKPRGEDPRRKHAVQRGDQSTVLRL